MPSASSTAPLRSDWALTAWAIAAIAGEGLSWTSRRSSLMTSGSTNGINASERRSAPTSSSAIAMPGLAQRVEAREHLGGTVGQGALGELQDDIELAGVAGEQLADVGRRGLREQRRLDVDEQGLAQLRVQGAAHGGGAARPLELGQQAARVRGREEPVGALQRRPHG